MGARGPLGFAIGRGVLYAYSMMNNTESTKYHQVTGETCLGALAPEVVENDDYPYNDDAFTLSPEEFVAFHANCIHEDDKISKRVRQITGELLTIV